MKYINKFDTAAEALAATDLITPQVVYVVEENSVLVPGDIYPDNTELEIKRDQGGDLVIEEYIPPFAGLKMTSTGVSTVKVNKMVYQYSNCDVKYSLDDGATWTQYGYGADEVITLQDGESVCLKGLNSSWAHGAPNLNNFALTGNIKLSGNIMSLVDDGACETLVIPAASMFYELFYGQTAITDISELSLPATTLAQSCYEHMFSGCTGITSIPANLLPATTLAQICYSCMFSGCTGITSIPNGLLPATTLAASCYYSMFSGCTGITSIPANLLPATTLATQCCKGMFKGCSGITSIPNGLLPQVSTVASGCYESMFEGTSITSVDVNLLPATTLASYCYASMFKNCTLLTNVPTLPATTIELGCYGSMFQGCTSLTTVPTNYLPGTNVVLNCYSHMFDGCVNLTVAPELNVIAPAVNGCYEYMFYNCAKINYVKCMLSAFHGVYSSVSYMLVGVAETGTLVKNPDNTEWGAAGTYWSYPEGWTVQDAA